MGGRGEIGLAGVRQAGSGGIQWAGRVPREQIRRLYVGFAAGLLDEDLLEEVGLAFYLRCRDILRATDAHDGRVHCPVCDGIAPHHWEPDAVLVCPCCGWTMPWVDYAATYRGRALHGGTAMHVWPEYLRR